MSQGFELTALHTTTCRAARYAAYKYLELELQLSYMLPGITFWRLEICIFSQLSKLIHFDE